MPIELCLQAALRDRSSWLDLAREAESSGYDTLYAADHPGVTPAPFVALAAAAAVTDRIRLGTCVVNAGAWEPIALAVEAATLDVVSAGRAVLGIGAGHTPSEWTAAGRRYPSPRERVDRMVEVSEAVQQLLAGATVTVAGSHVTLDEAVLEQPRPAQARVPVLIGGSGDRVLRHAARTADLVGITGLGRTLEDGHRHEVRWTATDLDRMFQLVLSAADDAGRSPVLDALVQHVELTADAEAAAAALAERVPGTTVADLLTAPFVWIGTAAEIADRLLTFETRSGLTRYTVRPPAMAAVAEVRQELSGALTVRRSVGVAERQRSD